MIRMIPKMDFADCNMYGVYQCSFDQDIGDIDGK